ncbi:hypothetical protein BD309DRAFT_975225, partial [Dichomitus squalens]
MKSEGSGEGLYSALGYLQSLLPIEGFAVGEHSLADIAIAPFFGRARAILVNDCSKGRAVGEGAKIWETITTGKFARLGMYVDDLFQRESYKATFDE